MKQLGIVAGIGSYLAIVEKARSHVAISDGDLRQLKAIVDASNQLGPIGNDFRQLKIIGHNCRKLKKIDGN